MRGVVIAALVLGLASSGRADDGAMTGVGGTLHLMSEHPHIAMVAEDVQARLDLATQTVDVECLFVLANDGAADSVLVGFPEMSAGDTAPEPFTFFESFVDGERVTCQRVDASAANESESRFWWTKQVTFAARQTRIVRDHYRAPAGDYVGDAQGPWRTFEYTLRTGASWEGTIGAATVTFAVTPCDSAFSAQQFNPAPDMHDGCCYRWHFSNIEPGVTGPHSLWLGWRVAR